MTPMIGITHPERSWCGKELAHLEAGHVADLPTYATCRGRCEVEAQSVAYSLMWTAAAHGLDASGYSFAYVAGWAGPDLSIVRQAAATVTQTARRILTPLDAAARGRAKQCPDRVRRTEPGHARHFLPPATPPELSPRLN